MRLPCAKPVQILKSDLCVQVEIILSIFRFSSSDTPTVKHQRAYETAC